MTSGLKAHGEQSRIADLVSENAALLQQIKVLQNREQANAELLAIVSHEIRTPIGAVMTMVELLQTTKLSTNQSHYAKTLQLAAKNLSTLTADILNFAKLEAGHVELEQETFALSGFIETIITSIAPRAEAKGLKFHCHIDSSCPEFIIGDQIRLSQIINNLVNNALKFTQEGTLRLSVSASYEENGHHDIRIELKDTGMGMSREEQEKIFTPFHQANSTIQTKFGGSGLGLYISRKLAEIMGGELNCKSHKDIGSTFWFTFNCKTARENEQQPDSQSKRAKTEKSLKGHALIVEDNDLNQMLIKTYLEHFGMTFECAKNGEEAVKMVQDRQALTKAGESSHCKQYDIILMDIMMPVMDGITATKELINLWQNSPAKPILALTANAMEDQVKAYYAAGMNGYISKPIRGEDLYKAIETLIAPSMAPSATPSEDKISLSA